MVSEEPGSISASRERSREKQQLFLNTDRRRDSFKKSCNRDLVWKEWGGRDRDGVIGASWIRVGLVIWVRLLWRWRKRGGWDYLCGSSLVRCPVPNPESRHGPHPRKGLRKHNKKICNNETLSPQKISTLKICADLYF